MEPQKKTTPNAQASGLQPEVAEMLDAVASFQQDDYVMTDAEARALMSRPNHPKIQVKPLSTRQ